MRSEHLASPVDAAPPTTLQAYLDGPPRIRQRALAKRLGVHQSMISMLAKGQRRPRAKLALLLHRITGVPLKALLNPQRPRQTTTARSGTTP